ncbi:hypothetical protein WA026_000620 [Henosepilachna vigintioctopunctata]|uniref:DUF4817 domain-containing protein n=1 Tax=Henosepilachna vigintioctopunctata TaxID=420089 RepID=A0AAW1V6J7_9CUCU
MEKLTNEQRLQIVEIYYRNSRSVENVYRLLQPYYDRHNRPGESTIRAVITKFRTEFTLLDTKPLSRMRTEEIVQEEPVEQASSTTETPKKYIKGGIVRPFRSNNDLSASLKRRREQAAFNKQHSKSVHQEAEESAPAEEKVATPSKSKSSSRGRKRFNSPKKEQTVEENEDQDAPAAAAPTRTRRRFNHRS